MPTIISNGSYKGIDEVDVSGRRVIVRADLNVPLAGSQVSDATRIERLVPTLENLSRRGARVIVFSHLGRPEGQRNAKYSLRPVAGKLSEIMGGKAVNFVEDSIGPVAKSAVAAMQPGEIVLLENLRFYPGEESNEADFVAELSSLGDIFVNDAFSVSHRAHASVYGIAHQLPAFAGPQMLAELEAFKLVLELPKRPVAAIVGGAKVSTKIPLLSNLAPKVDMLIIGGGMANTFLHAQGYKIGKSLCEPDFADTVEEIMSRAAETGCRIVLPTDAVVATKFEPNAPSAVYAVTDIPADGMILDIGPKSIADFGDRIRSAKTLLWNGPVGAFETPPFEAGTFALARLAAERTQSGHLVTVAGGGDTVAALNKAGVTESFSYVSTAGGAFLEWLEGRELPGVVALAQARAPAL
ncbi:MULTISPECIES: phosphoglycerate kinase [Rhodomicrobium]|uniref:phosphoglycerate kinase n=1 Tax=Rhodomicrobium TaxID=1068 RepID=UPI000B4A8F9C|nr:MULTISPECIES: phosphoglycerate kinase [Rhodomicrobium]